MKKIEDMNDKEKVYHLLSTLDHVCKDTRERSGDDWVCGLCEWDGPAWMECPGFESDECFRMEERYVAQYLDEPEYTQWYQENYGDDGRKGR